MSDVLDRIIRTGLAEYKLSDSKSRKKKHSRVARKGRVAAAGTPIKPGGGKWKEKQPKPGK